jgi:hypothetical protein
MIRLKKTFAIMLLVTTVPAAYSQSAQDRLAAAQAQMAARNSNGRTQMTQAPVEVDGKHYTVTEYPGGPSGHMVSLAGPDGTAMVSVDKNNKIATYISPSGGNAPDGRDFKPLINQVWTAYLDQKNQAAAANSNTAAPADARNETPTNPVSTPPASNQPIVKSMSDASIVIFDPKLGTDVTFTENGMKATWTVTPKVPQGMPVAVQPENFTAFFEGGDKPASAGKKLGKVFTSGAVQTLDSLNTRADAVSGIGANPDKVWRVNVQEGNKKRNVYESGEYRSGGFKVATGKDPAEKQGISILLAIRKDWEAAQPAIVEAQKEGKATGFDFTTDRYQRGSAALQAATKGYDIQQK